MRETKILNLFLLAQLVVLSVRSENRHPFTDGLENLFQEIGFSPSCVSQTLAHCENSAKGSFLMGMKTQTQIIETLIEQAKNIHKRPRNCADLLHAGDTESGVRTVYPFLCCDNRPVSVFCDQSTDSGGWTVFQHREALPQREKFFRNWIEYEIGFGKLDGEFWLGLRNIHALVSSTLMELRVDLEDFKGKKRWAKYEYFYIADANDKYRLDLGTYSGNAGDSLKDGHNGEKFSTKDQDNDSHPGNCAESYLGGWWFKGCHSSNLNGYQYEGNHTSHADGINWNDFRGHKYSLKITSLAIRPKF